MTWRGTACIAQEEFGDQDNNMLVHKHRVQRGWSQEQLAEMSGVSPRTIQRIEAGANPSIESLKAIASVFEIDWSELREAKMQDSQTRENAIEEALALAQVRKVKRFYIHLGEFAAIMGIMVALNLYFTPSYLWSLWLFAFWSLGVVVMGLQTFKVFPFMSGEWERRQVERRLGRRL